MTHYECSHNITNIHNAHFQYTPFSFVDIRETTIFFFAKSQIIRSPFQSTMMRNTFNQCIWLLIAIIIWIDQADAADTTPKPGTAPAASPKGAPAAPADGAGGEAAGEGGSFFEENKVMIIIGVVALLIIFIIICAVVSSERNKPSSQSQSGVAVELEIEPPVANMV